MRPEPKLSHSPDPSGGASLGLPVSLECSQEECQQELLRILDSPYFSGSKRLSEFVSFSARAALAGRTEIDQYEVAAEVLNRAEDFNPLDDASVRKLASQVRAKLEEYYQEQGAADPIVVSLPRRSYVLRFRLNETDTPSAVQASTAETLNERSAEPPASPFSRPSAMAMPSGISAEETASERDDATDDMRSANPGAQAAFPLPEAAELPRRTRTRAAWIIGLALTAMAVGIGIYQAWPSRQAGPSGAASGDTQPLGGEFQIVSKFGDLRGKGGVVSPGAVLIGPGMDLDGDATVRMSFLPESAGQHGGLMIFQDADNYVRFGSHFKVRSMFEFGHEVNGSYSMPESSYEFDPLAQSGLPLWLSIRKQGERFTAFSSRDGQHWERFGAEQLLASPLAHPMAALYAFNGRTNSPEVMARFRDLGVGLRFHHRSEGPARAADFPGWNIHTSCGISDSTLMTVRDRAFEMQFPEDQLCGSAMERAWEAPREKPWYVEAYVDFQAVNGSSAAILVRTDKGTVRLARRDLNGGSIMLERNVDRDVSMPDFPGAPPVYLRLASQDGYLSASFSRDGENYRTIPERIPLAELGAIHGYGLETDLSHWLRVGRRPPARLISIEHGLLALTPMEQPADLP